MSRLSRSTSPQLRSLPTRSPLRTPTPELVNGRFVLPPESKTHKPLFPAVHNTSKQNTAEHDDIVDVHRQRLARMQEIFKVAHEETDVQEKNHGKQANSMSRSKSCEPRLAIIASNNSSVQELPTTYLTESQPKKKDARFSASESQLPPTGKRSSYKEFSHRQRHTIFDMNTGTATASISEIPLYPSPMFQYDMEKWLQRRRMGYGRKLTPDAIAVLARCCNQLRIGFEDTIQKSQTYLILEAVGLKSYTTLAEECAKKASESHETHKESPLDQLKFDDLVDIIDLMTKKKGDEIIHLITSSSQNHRVVELRALDFHRRDLMDRITKQYSS